jgi:hypothetical protein
MRDHSDESMDSSKQSQSSSGDCGPRARLSRRRVLKGFAGAGALAVSSLSGCLSAGAATRDTPAVTFSSQQGRVTRQHATHVVRTASALRSAVGTADAVVWIPESVTIDISNDFGTEVATNVTIASNRGLGGAGGLLRSTSYVNGHFTTRSTGEGYIRLSGIRLRGPRTDYFDPRKQAKPESYYYAAGFRLFPQRAIVDNCEVFGWTNAGLLFGTKDTPTASWIHHNQMHHNQMETLGYPFELYNGLARIEWNYFAKYRHAITAYGYPTNGYEARYNVVGPPGGSEYAFAFDMHSLGEQDNYPSSNTTAGKYVDVHHNVFTLTDHNALSVSGIPTQYARFVTNWCATSKGGDGPGVPAVSIPTGATLYKKKNQFGKSAVKQGLQRLTAAAKQRNA